VSTSVYLLNRILSRVLNFHTPLQTLEHYVKLPSTLHIPPKIFGCVVFVHVLKHQRSKLHLCVVCSVLPGYGSHTKGYWCYDPLTRKLYVTMDITFLEIEYFFNKPSSSIFQGENRHEQHIWDWVHPDHTQTEP
jgi:hypothetical protein